jgi:hypothetical protein
MTTTQTENNGREWSLVAKIPGAEMWRADDADLMAHGWAVCIPGDEPGNATWSTTTTEACARQWFAEDLIAATQKLYWDPIHVAVDNLGHVWLKGYDRDQRVSEVTMGTSPEKIALAAQWAALGCGTYRFF